MQKAAVIGIGSNSVRMLVAQIEEDGFTRLTRDREGTRLFAGLDEHMAGLRFSYAQKFSDKPFEYRIDGRIYINLKIKDYEEVITLSVSNLIRRYNVTRLRCQN